MKNVSLKTTLFIVFSYGFLSPLSAESFVSDSVHAFLEQIREPTRLIKEGAQANWSPDGNRIAYSYMPGGEERFNGGGILLYQLDGSHQTMRLTADGKNPAWSPNGEWIAYVRAGYDDILESIWLIDSKGKRRPQLLAEGGYPQWMPDGRSILYHSRQTSSVCKVEIERGKPKAKETLFNCNYGYPRLSPDGREITLYLPSLSSYFRDQKQEGVLMIMDLQQHIKRQQVLPYQNILMAWSPDGQHLAFGGMFANHLIGLHVMEADMKSPPRLLQPGSWSRPSWSPDGHYLVYDTIEDGNLEIWIMKYDSPDR